MRFTRFDIFCAVLIGLLISILIYLMALTNASHAATPVVIIERDLSGNELASERGTLYYLQHAGTDGLLFEFTPEVIFENGFEH